MMKHYSVQQLSTLPVILANFTPKFSFESDFMNYRSDIAHHLNELSEPVYYVLNMEYLQFDVMEISNSINLAARINNPNFHHHNVYQVIFVSDNPIWEQIAQGLSNDIYGNLQVPVFASEEDALAYVQAQIG
jgi:hypothetical protein